MDDTHLHIAQRRCRICDKTHPLTEKFFGHLPTGGFRHQCRSCIRARSRAYDAANPDKVRARSKKYQARKQRWTPSAELIRSLFVEQHGGCPACGKDLEAPWSVDHLLPVAQGGTNEEHNLILLHRACNQEKHSKTWEEYLNWRRKCGMPWAEPPSEACAAKILAHMETPATPGSGLP